MKIYKIKVNGKTYKVELEAIDEVASAAPTAVAPAQASAPAAAPASTGTGEGKEVLSPIQGQVVSVNVKVGDTVKKGAVLCVIEAMKLENEVNAEFDGTVTEVCVTKGQNVTAKQLLVKIK
jgi:biotin carboxyl carrier protein